MLTALLLAVACQLPPEPPADAPVLEKPTRIARDLTGMTKAQLEEEIVRLDGARPNFSVPVGLMIGGGVSLILAVTMFVGYIAESLIGSGQCFITLGPCTRTIFPNPARQGVFLGASVVTVAGGIAGLVVGGILMKVRGDERRPYSEAIEAAEAQIAELEMPVLQPNRPRAPAYPPGPL